MFSANNIVALLLGKQCNYTETSVAHVAHQLQSGHVSIKREKLLSYIMKHVVVCVCVCAYVCIIEQASDIQYNEVSACSVYSNRKVCHCFVADIHHVGHRQVGHRCQYMIY